MGTLGMEYSQPDQGSYYRPVPYPQQPQPVNASVPSHSYTAQSDQLSPPPTPLSATPHMSAPGSHAGSQGSHDQSYMTARPMGEASSSRGTGSPGEVRAGPSSRVPAVKRTGAKANVSAACGPCKKAHLACDVQRPCKRCTNMGKEDMCEDVPVGLASSCELRDVADWVSTRKEVDQKSTKFPSAHHTNALEPHLIRHLSTANLCILPIRPNPRAITTHLIMPLTTQMHPLHWPVYLHLKRPDRTHRICLHCSPRPT